MQVGHEFENKGESITGDEHIAKGFTNYFVNVGPSLADNIPAADAQFSQYLSASTNVKNSLFLNPVRGTCLRRTPLTPTNDIQLQWQIKRS